MPSLRQRIRVSDRAPMRLTLVFPNPAATYEYRVNGATSETGINQDVNADSEFFASDCSAAMRRASSRTPNTP